ncbi:uncharacterized protein LOC134709516 [Mytilus trossulus]|uniref:uncharacterized protein LOC134709516 n=1 Tax=Mytilus trossulus TaxID=6551 RepID=UPI003005068D
MRSVALDAFCFVTVIILLGNACGYTFLENLQNMIDNERRKDFSTLDEFPLFKLDNFMRTNLNTEYDQADNSILNEKRQMIEDYKMLSKRVVCTKYGCNILASVKKMSDN